MAAGSAAKAAPGKPAINARNAVEIMARLMVRISISSCLLHHADPSRSPPSCRRCFAAAALPGGMAAWLNHVPVGSLRLGNGPHAFWAYLLHRRAGHLDVDQMAGKASCAGRARRLSLRGRNLREACGRCPCGSRCRSCLPASPRGVSCVPVAAACRSPWPRKSGSCGISGSRWPPWTPTRAPPSRAVWPRTSPACRWSRGSCGTARWWPGSCGSAWASIPWARGNRSR